MDKEELKSIFLKLVDYLLMHGEMLKGLWYLQNAPAYIEEDITIKTRLGKTLSHLTEIERVQRNGKINTGFIVPEDIDKKVGFKLLRKNLLKLGLKKLVDVGCFSGWIGKTLSLDGIAVHGIDIAPVTLHLASMYNAGSLATFEYCPAEQFGNLHPKQYDGAILFDILEHTVDPAVVLKSIKQSIKDGGWIFLNLPHPQGENKSHDACSFEEHEHLYNFSQKEIEKLMGKEKNFNLKIIENEGRQINWFIKYQV